MNPHEFKQAVMAWGVAIALFAGIWWLFSWASSGEGPASEVYFDEISEDQALEDDYYSSFRGY